MFYEGFLCPDGSWSETAPAIRTDEIELLLRALATEGALEGTDHRLCGFRGKIFVAAFTIWAKLQHLPILLA